MSISLSIHRPLGHGCREPPISAPGDIHKIVIRANCHTTHDSRESANPEQDTSLSVKAQWNHAMIYLSSYPEVSCNLSHSACCGTWDSPFAILLGLSNLGTQIFSVVSKEVYVKFRF